MPRLRVAARYCYWLVGRHWGSKHSVAGEPGREATVEPVIMRGNTETIVDTVPKVGGTGLSSLALLATTGTLVCCALPILLVSIGLGATVAAMTTAFPFLMTMSEYKVWVFAGSAVLLGITAWTLWRPGQACPTDPVLAEQCRKVQRVSRVIFWSGVGIWGVGFAAAYLALPVRIWLGV